MSHHDEFVTKARTLFDALMESRGFVFDDTKELNNGLYSTVFYRSQMNRIAINRSMQEGSPLQIMLARNQADDNLNSPGWHSLGGVLSAGKKLTYEEMIHKVRQVQSMTNDQYIQEMIDSLVLNFDDLLEKVNTGYTPVVVSTD